MYLSLTDVGRFTRVEDVSSTPCQKEKTGFDTLRFMISEKGLQASGKCLAASDCQGTPFVCIFEVLGGIRGEVFTLLEDMDLTFKEEIKTLNRVVAVCIDHALSNLQGGGEVVEVDVKNRIVKLRV